MRYKKEFHKYVFSLFRSVCTLAPKNEWFSFLYLLANAQERTLDVQALNWSANLYVAFVVHKYAINWVHNRKIDEPIHASEFKTYIFHANVYNEF